MLIDSLARTLQESGAMDGFWTKMDALEDASMGVASSARPFLVAARFARTPQPTLVVVPGEEAAETTGAAGDENGAVPTHRLRGGLPHEAADKHLSVHDGRFRFGAGQRPQQRIRFDVGAEVQKAEVARILRLPGAHQTGRGRGGEIVPHREHEPAGAAPVLERCAHLVRQLVRGLR